MTFWIGVSVPTVFDPAGRIGHGWQSSVKRTSDKKDLPEKRLLVNLYRASELRKQKQFGSTIKVY